MAIRAFIGSRQEIAVLNLKDNPAYQEILRQLEISGQTAVEMLHKLEKEERIAVRRHYEEEAHKFSKESDEFYLQGIRDCLSALVFFGALGADRDCGKKYYAAIKQ